MFLFSLTATKKKKKENEGVHRNNSIGELVFVFF